MNDAKIKELVGRIVEIVRPLRVVLFGSAGSGSDLPDSDIDLMVVMPDGTHRRNTAGRLYAEIKGLGVPFDIIVATPEDLARHRGNRGLIYDTILSEGRDVYVA